MDKFKRLVNEMVTRFPGLIDGESEVNGADLVDHLSDALDNFGIKEHYGREKKETVEHVRKMEPFLAKKKNLVVKIAGERACIAEKGEGEPIAAFCHQGLGPLETAQLIADTLEEMGIAFKREF